MAERPAWSITRAAEECGTSRATIKRRRAAGNFPNAFQDTRGRWMIPVTDLFADGLHPGKPKTNGSTDLGQDNREPGTHSIEVKDLGHQIAVLRVELEAERRLRAAAEQNAADLRTSLKMLETAPAVPAPTDSWAPPQRHRKWLGWLPTSPRKAP